MKYFVSGMVDEAGLGAVVRAFGGEVTLSALPGNQASAPEPTPVDAIHAMHPPAQAKRTVKRITKGNGDWPAKGSIYDTVLQAVQSEPKTPVALREILTAGGFSPGSVNSALGRLEKANKIRKGEEGWIAA